MDPPYRILPTQIKFIIEPNFHLVYIAVTDTGANQNILPRILFDRIDRHVGGLKTRVKRDNNEDVLFVTLLCEIRGAEMEIEFRVANRTNSVFIGYNYMNLAELNVAL